MNKNSPPLGDNAEGVFYASGSVSRVLSWTTIYLALPLPAGSSHLPRTTGPVLCPPTVLLRIEFTASTCLHATSELLPHFSTLTDCSAVYFCCTCPRVTPGGRYPLSLPYGARTFLTHRLSPYARGRPTRLQGLFYHVRGTSQQ